MQMASPVVALEAPRHGAQSQAGESRCQGHRSQSEVAKPRPCKNRKDGDPPLISEINSSTERWAARLRG